MIRERPIVFSTQMVRALLDGRKTQTRRVVTPQPSGGAVPHSAAYEADKQRWFWHDAHGGAMPLPTVRCPFGAPGDRLWVKETWCQPFKATPTENGCTYLADYGHRLDLVSEEEAREAWAWKSSRFMPRSASRLTLEVEAVRVERLQGIDTPEIQAEGVQLVVSPQGNALIGISGPHAMIEYLPESRHKGTPKYGADFTADDFWRATWASGWDRLNAKRGHGWATNPWVWVVIFRRCS